MKFYPLKRGFGKVLAMPVAGGGGGHKKFSGIFNTAAWSFSHTEGGHTKFPPFKRGGATKITLSSGWGGGNLKSFGNTIFPIL